MEADFWKIVLDCSKEHDQKYPLEIAERIKSTRANLQEVYCDNKYWKRTLSEAQKKGLIDR